MSELFFEFKGNRYPDYVRKGNAKAFIEPAARFFCKGNGLDIGGGRYPLEGAFCVDSRKGPYDAFNLPPGEYDYIFSSHCLEHLQDYEEALRIWARHIRPGGVLFLYLPHGSMELWWPENNSVHFHRLWPKDIERLLLDLGFVDVMVTDRDAYFSFTAVGIKSIDCDGSPSQGE